MYFKFSVPFYQFISKRYLDEYTIFVGITHVINSVLSTVFLYTLPSQIKCVKTETYSETNVR